MTAGHGYRYLLSSVAAGDSDRSLSTPLTDYYAAQGTPPGRWLGQGVALLGDGHLQPGDIVTEDQLRLLLGEGRDPLTGTPLGRAYPAYRDGGRQAVAGYDLTFSPPKSVSALWAITDADTRARIVAAHHAAVADVIALLEREVAATRIGATGPDGAVAHVDVAGVIATAFDHYDSRTGDAQLHTHLVVSNKVRTVSDGKWRSLDSRAMHAAVVGLSEHYNAVLADHLARTLGVGWEARQRGADRIPGWEITGIPQALIEAFSSRSAAIQVETDRLITTYRREHGHQPSARTVIRLRAQATLATRPDKTVHSLADLTQQWRDRARVVLGQDATTWAASMLATQDPPRLVAADALSADVVAAVGRRVVAAVGERRATWRHWNLHAEASRQLMGIRFATTADREAVLDRVVHAAEQVSLRLTPPELAPSPEPFRRPDGTSRLFPKHATVFTSAELLAAEDRLLSLGRAATGPTVPADLIAAIAGHPDRQGRRLGGDQTAALTAIATSGRVVDVLVGPAGAGKTTALRALRHAWETRHGPESVVGLAPSAAAAQVLAEDLGSPTDNTAKWLHDHTAGQAGLRTGQLLIVDEASLAGTQTLDAITSHAAQTGAKVLLVGDWAQLAAVDAGGAFAMLVGDRAHPPELTTIRRFAEPWEADTTLRLRNGDAGAIDTYQARGRLREGDTDAMVEAAYTAWKADLDAGRNSLLIAHSRDTVTALNSKARADRIRSGQVVPTDPVRLHNGTDASTGDIVITRHNDRRLLAGRGWVRNGDRWKIIATRPDGSITVRRASHEQGAAVRLPAAYVAEHVELGYAVTCHRAQGATVDTAHAIVAPGMTRETMYVAMTRGRQANTAYTCTDQPDTEPHHQPEDNSSGRSVLAGILARVGTEVWAHEVIAQQQDRASSIAQLAAEYDTIAAAAQHDRWARLIRHCGLTSQQAETVITSEAFGPLTATLRRAEAHHHDINTLLARVVTAEPLHDAHDIAAVLHHRLNSAVARGGGSQPGPAPRLIAGLIPPALGPVRPEMRAALDERAQLIEQRADRLTVAALANHEPWTRHLGTPPDDRHQRQTWVRQVRTIAAYRDRYQITADTPLGPSPTSAAQRRHALLASGALLRAQQVATVAPPHPRLPPSRAGQSRRLDGPSI